MQELINFTPIERHDWQSLHQKNRVPLTEDELNAIKSFNDSITIQEVSEVYLPLISLIQIYKHNQDNLNFSKSMFLQERLHNRPFIIGISGSVAVGKSTTSRLIQLLLERTYKKSKVELVTTDGFLYPNEYLIANNILNKKGFPESYDMERLLNFLDTVKNNGRATMPVYSHDIYDIVPDQVQAIEAPDFLIVEGINVFQNQQNNRLYMSDYFDFSIYIDADSQIIENWYLERFEKHLERAREDTTSYYHKFALWDRADAQQFAKNIWKTINLVNLENYIEPTRNRAELILHKGENHKIDKIYLKK